MQKTKAVPLHTLPEGATFWLPLCERKGEVLRSGSVSSIGVKLWASAQELPEGDRELLGEKGAVQTIDIGPMTYVIPLES